MPNLIADTSFYGGGQQGPQGILGLLKLVNALKGGADQDTTQNTVSNTPGLPPIITQGPPAAGSAPVAPQKLADMYQDAEQDNDLPAGYLSTTGGIESSHNPRAFNEFGYKGLMQLGSDESKGINVWDPAQNIQRAAEIAVRNREHFQQVFGRDPTAGELYLMHQQGIAGGPALLKNPNMPAYQALMTAGVPQGKAIRSISANGGNPAAPASQFTQKWTSHFDNSPGASQALAYSPAGASKLDAQGNEIPVQTVKYTPGGDDDPAMQRHLQKKDSEDSAFTQGAPGVKYTPGGDDDPAMQRHLGKDGQNRFSDTFEQFSDSGIDVSKNAPAERRGIIADKMQEKSDPYADHPLSLQFPGIKRAFERGGGEGAKTISELIKWGKRNPEEAGAAAAAIGTAGVVGGRALLPLAAAVPGVAAAARVGGSLAKKIGEYSLVSTGLHELGPVARGAEGLAQNIWELIAGGGH